MASAWRSLSAQGCCELARSADKALAARHWRGLPDLRLLEELRAMTVLTHKLATQDAQRTAKAGQRQRRRRRQGRGAGRQRCGCEVGFDRRRRRFRACARARRTRHWTTQLWMCRAGPSAARRSATAAAIRTAFAASTLLHRRVLLGAARGHRAVREATGCGSEREELGQEIIDMLAVLKHDLRAGISHGVDVAWQRSIHGHGFQR